MAGKDSLSSPGGGVWDLYDDMKLYITPKNFFVEPIDKDEILVIGRIDKVCRVEVKTSQLWDHMWEVRICGIIGTIHLVGCDYLIVATHRTYVGKLNDAIIWRLAGFEIIPYIPNTIHRPANEAYLNMLRKTLDTQYFYFAYLYDLTHSLQRQHRMSPTFRSQKSLFQRADRRFIWNGQLLRNFNSKEMGRFQLPLIHGFVSITRVVVNARTFFYSIISRRSVERAGTRLFCRGSNERGHVANYVETEQIAEFNGQRTSLVQTRGSMPFYWHQLPNLRYKPRPQIIHGNDHLGACRQHFRAQIEIYGPQVIVNLVDQKGAEGQLEEAFRTLVREMANPQVRYEAFDFHTECKKMRWDRLNILIDRLAHEQEEFGFFHARDDGSLISTQTGVFRTNCIDCLDRTNVVQSMLARRSLNSMLQKLGILHPGQSVEVASDLSDLVIKGVWADNADLISIQYSGTGALKTDFTRTGKRTMTGVMHDGMNSMKRYYLNNFADGDRQDGIHLFLGLQNVNNAEDPVLPWPLVTKRSWRYNTFPSILVFAVTMFVISIPSPYSLNTENLLFMLFWGSMIAVSVTGILHYGIEFVQWPRLFPPIKFEA